MCEQGAGVTVEEGELFVLLAVGAWKGDEGKAAAGVEAVGALTHCRCVSVFCCDEVACSRPSRALNGGLLV